MTRFLYTALFALLVSGGAPGLRAQINPSVSYEYDNYGNCKAMTNELGQKSTYAYDAYRRPTSYTEPLNAPDWNGNGTVVSRTWNWTYEREIEETGQTYDASAHTGADWSTQTEPAFDAAGDRRMSARTFDLNNRLLSETTGLINGVSGPDTETHRYNYDGNDNKISYLDPRLRLTRYTYDLRNRLKDTIAPKRDDETENPTTSLDYDFVGNKTKVTFPDARTQMWNNYNAFGEARQFVDERSDVTDMTYQWGPMKKLATVTTHRGTDSGGVEDQLTQFSYDGMGRLKTTIFPDASTEVSSYDSGQVISFKTRRNQTKHIAYDGRGREQSNNWDGGAAPGITRQWDDAGRLSGIWNSYATLDFGHDAAGQLSSEGDTVAGTGRTQSTYYRYQDGGVAHIIYPSGFRNRRDYTARGQVAAAGWDDTSGNWVEKAIKYTYLADGKVDFETSGNGVRSDLSYDARAMIKSVHVTQTAGGATLTDRSYTRDIRDRITSYLKGTDATRNGLENGRGDFFHYDDEGQMYYALYEALDDTADGDAQRGDVFTYDALGNRYGSNVLASNGSVDFTRRDNGLNQYLNWGVPVPGTALLYDDNFGQGYVPPGNGVLMREGMFTASYNALNQPIAISTPAFGPDEVLWFGYDPLGRPVKRWLAPQAAGDPATNPATYFTYDDGWNLLQEGASSASVSRTYVHGGRVDEIVASSPNVPVGQWYYHHYDARGHAILLTDVNGNLVEQYDYDAFGEPYFFNAAGTELGESAVGNRFLFTGREWLSDLRIYDFRNRLYHPLLGRFLQPDPKQFMAGDYNLYRYVHNDPVNRTDPTGLDPIGRAIGELVGGYVFGVIGTDVGVAAGAATGFVGGIETGPGELVTVPVGAISGGVTGGGIGTATGINIGGNVGDHLGDRLIEGIGKVRNALESRGRDQGERRRQGSNPNSDKRQARDHQTGKKLPPKAAEKPRQPDPEVIPKGKKKPGE